MFCITIAVTLLGSLAGPACASFHLMQIEEVIGGVNGDSSAQAIQLRMRAAGQNFLQSDAGGPDGPAKLVVRDATGNNPVTLITFPHDLTNGHLGDHVLIATASFASHASPSLVPDFIMTNPIPAADLAAGRLTYESPGGILWSLAYGGSAYTGPTSGVPPFNSPSGDSGKFSGPLPTAGLQGMDFLGSASATSTSNATDYALTPGPAVFTNNLGQSFTTSAVPEPASLMLMGVGGVLILARRQRRSG